MFRARLLRRQAQRRTQTWAQAMCSSARSPGAATAPCRTASARSSIAAWPVLSSFSPSGWTEHAAMLAYHFAEAGGQTRALSCSLRAGDHAMAVYAVAEALLYFEPRAGACGGRLSGD